jgi:hypothetical protein
LKTRACPTPARRPRRHQIAQSRPRLDIIPTADGVWLTLGALYSAAQIELASAMIVALGPGDSGRPPRLAVMAGDDRLRLAWMRGRRGIQPT